MKHKCINIFKFSTFKIIFAVLILLILVQFESKFNLNHVFATPSNTFKITRNTLHHLQREGFTKALTKMFLPC